MKKEINFCYECSEYPCKILKRLDKSYQMRYKESLVKKMSIIETMGMDYYLEKERERLKCSECGHELNLHDKICHMCSKNFRSWRVREVEEC